MTNGMEIEANAVVELGKHDSSEGWPSSLLKWLDCCAGLNPAGEVEKSEVEPEPRQRGSSHEPDQATVLILASSDVLHAIRSPFVNVRVVPTRKFPLGHGVP